MEAGPFAADRKERHPFPLKPPLSLGLLFCLLLAVAVRVAFFRGIFAFDDLNYLRHAAELWKGHYALGDIGYWHGLRILLFAPVSGSMAVLGVSEMSAVLWPILCSLGSIVLIFLVGRELHGSRAGLLAACLAAFLPLGVEEATRLVPGAMLNLIVAASTYAYLRSERGGRSRGWVLALSGMLFATIPWVGHLGLIYGIFFAVAILFFRKHPLLSYWPLVAGAAAFLFLAGICQWLSSGDALINFTVAGRILNTENDAPRLFFYTGRVLRPFATHGGIFYLAAIGALLAVIRLRRGALLATAWFVVTYLIMELGSTSLSEYRPLFKQARYLSILTVPGSVLAGACLVELQSLFSSRQAGTSGKPVFRNTAGGLLAAALLAAVFAGSLVTLAKPNPWRTRMRRIVEETGERSRRFQGQTIYVMHWVWNTRVGYYMGYDDAYFPSGYDPYAAVALDKAENRSLNRYVQSLTPGERMQPGLLILDEKLLADSRGEQTNLMVGPGEVPECLFDPPEEWQLLERIGDAALYQIPAGSIWPGGTVR
ncbi:glycosyltransferase family 39 protein [Candidatus Eisenbacteria bacterium]|uniref:Glycosyltransferase family 39 protein n=1 Tax=Eiseniibacteriota bacterium TaxID=2212470 RepID=A0ABV6YJH2_UNCEI